MPKKTIKDPDVNCKHGITKGLCYTCKMEWIDKEKEMADRMIKEMDSKHEPHVPPVAIKKCPSCKEVKPRNDFGMCKSYADGLNRICKVCSKEAKKRHKVNRFRKAVEAITANHAKKTPDAFILPGSDFGLIETLPPYNLPFYVCPIHNPDDVWASFKVKEWAEMWVKTALKPGLFCVREG